MIKNLLIAIVRAYQIFLSPLLHIFGGGCRFHPTCSSYTIQALQLHGATRGLWLGLRRICRCHPWGKFGDDPVPEKWCDR